MIHRHTTDEALLAAIRKGDYVCYNQLFARYYTRLCQYVYSFLENKEDTEDVVQELFLNIWNNRRKTAIRENGAGYLYTMAKNMSLNHLRATKNYRTLLEKQEPEPDSDEENVLESDEFRIALYDCIDRLPERSRQVFLLHRIEGMKQKDIAEKLKISVKTIKNQVWMSLQKLRKCVERKTG
jgi:RNA polymerase sigma-70 factor (ECF subfamily)